MMKRKKLLAVIMLALSSAVCGGMDASAVWQMDEVNVVGDRYDADNAQTAPTSEKDSAAGTPFQLFFSKG